MLFQQREPVLVTFRAILGERPPAPLSLSSWVLPEEGLPTQGHLQTGCRMLCHPHQVAHSDAYNGSSLFLLLRRGAWQGHLPRKLQRPAFPQAFLQVGGLCIHTEGMLAVFSSL